jgi:hypothetical protein
MLDVIHGPLSHVNFHSPGINGQKNSTKSGIPYVRKGSYSDFGPSIRLRGKTRVADILNEGADLLELAESDLFRIRSFHSDFRRFRRRLR